MPTAQPSGDVCPGSWAHLLAKLASSFHTICLPALPLLPFFSLVLQNRNAYRIIDRGMEDGARMLSDSWVRQVNLAVHQKGGRVRFFLDCSHTGIPKTIVAILIPGMSSTASCAPYDYKSETK